MSFEVIALLVVVSVIIGNYTINRMVIAWTLKNYIKPFFTKNGIQYVHFKRTSFFSTGAFKEGSFNPVFSPKGNANRTTYFYAIGKNQEEKEIQFTAKVELSFFSVRGIEIKKEPNTKSIVLN